MQAVSVHPQNTISTLDALWTLFQAQTEAVQRAFIQRAMEAEEAKRKAQEKRFKESFTRAVHEMRKTQSAGVKQETLDEFLSTL